MRWSKRHIVRIIIMRLKIALIALVALVSAPAGVLAQADSTTAELTVQVRDDPGMLLVTATYTPGGTLIFKNGGVSEGYFDVDVVDARLAGNGWQVGANVSDFTTSGPAPDAFEAKVDFTLIAVEPAGTYGKPTLSLESGSPGPPEYEVFMSSPGLGTAHGQWNTSFPVPANTEVGNYTATVTFEVVTGDPQ
jgi:hypothetical protein